MKNFLIFFKADISVPSRGSKLCARDIWGPGIDVKKSQRQFVSEGKYFYRRSLSKTVR